LEILISLGKTYFYNCKTEVSQWEKPKGWPSNESNRTSTSSISSTDRIKKGSIGKTIFVSEKFLWFIIESTTHISPTIRTRYKVEESSSQISTSKLTSENSNNHQNGNHKFQESLQSNEQLPITSQNRLPSPGLFPIQQRIF